MRGRHGTIILGLILLGIFVAGRSWGAAFDLTSSTIGFGLSYDRPPTRIEEVLESRLESNTTFKLVNGIANEIEKWSDSIAVSVTLLAELSAWADRNTFGWYNTETYSLSAPGTHGQIFAGTVGPGGGPANRVLSITPPSMGFYIDPYGLSGRRMFTEHCLNSESDYQVAIWQINGSEYDYILAWEDLDLNGGSGGDRDYQDFVVRIELTPSSPVPIPASVLLLGSGVVGLALIRRKASKR